METIVDQNAKLMTEEMEWMITNEPSRSLLVEQTFMDMV
jgi:hypothetical protein